MKYFFNEKDRDRFARWATEHGYHKHNYRYVAGVSLIYVCKYWR